MLVSVCVCVCVCVCESVFVWETKSHLKNSVVFVL